MRNNIPYAEVSGVISFYNFFTATPNGADLTVVEESRGVMERLQKNENLPIFVAGRHPRLQAGRRSTWMLSQVTLPSTWAWPVSRMATCCVPSMGFC